MQEDKNGEDMTITPGSTDLVYIRSCSQCKFGVHGRSAKCIIGKRTPTPFPVHTLTYAYVLFIDCTLVLFIGYSPI